MEDTQALTRITIKSTLWNYTSFAVSKAITFLVTIILARVLVPEDFGLLSMGLIAINYLDMLNEMGVGPALIYQQGDLEKKSNVAFSMGITINAALTLIAFVAAPWVAEFFKEPRVIPVIQALSLTFVLSSIGSIQSSRLKKELNFKRILIPEIGKTIVKGGVAIGLAFTGFGVWSLVAGQITGILFSSILYWIIMPWRPKFDFEAGTIRSLFGYGSQMILVNILGMFHENIDYVIIGRRMDSEQLGYYTMAYRVPELIIINICVVVSRALFPAYSRIQDDFENLKKGFLAALRYVSLLTVPLGIGLWVLSKEFIDLFFSSKWSASIPVMQVLSLYAVVYSLGFNAGDIYKAIGKPWILNAIGMVKLVIILPVLWLLAGTNIFAVAMGLLIVNIFLTSLELVIASRILSIGAGQIFKAIQPAVIGGLVMFAGLRAMDIQMATASAWTRLIMFPLLGILIYSAFLWFANRDVIWSALNLARSVARS